MTEDELRRASLAEKRIRDFKIVNPDGSVQGGFGKLPLGTQDHGERLSNIEKALSQFQLIGGAGVNVSGGIAHGGYTIEAKKQVSDSGTGGGNGGGDVPGCTDPTALNFNPSATVDDGSCIYATGACCVGVDCSITTEASCGGVYQGNGTTCDPNPCGGCPEITLLCDSIHASKCKCGFPAFDGSGPVYLTQDYDAVNILTQCCCSNPVTETCTAQFNGHNHLTTTYNPSDCSHSDTDAECTHGHTLCDGTTNTTGDCPTFSPDTVTGPTSKIYGSGGTSTSACDGSACGSGGHCVGETSTTHTASYTLSNEYTTADLISNTEAALPAYFGHFGCDENEEIGFRTEGQNCTCFASRELAENETCYEINRFKYKFTFSPSATDFTINWNEHTVPDVGGPSDNPMSELILAGATESGEYEVSEPADNGTISIADITCTPA